MARATQAGEQSVVTDGDGVPVGTCDPRRDTVTDGDDPSARTCERRRDTGADGATPSWAPPDRPLRADARRNRDAVLGAAAEAFAAQGVEAPLEDIARAAGVGVGTLYRHFPTREALVFGVYAREVEQLAAAAPELAAGLEPLDALREWMRRFVHYAATKRGLIGMLRTMMADNTDLFDRTKQQISAAADALLQSAARAGQIRSDISAGDITRSLGGICMASDPAAGPDSAGRLVDLVFDGLRYGAPETR